MKKIFLLISTILLISCQKKIQHFVKSEYQYHRFDNKINTEDKEIKAIIEPYKTKLDKQMNEVIGELDVEMIKAKPSSNLTNFVADAVRNQFEKETGEKLDVVILNYGGIRLNSWAAGEIRIGEIFEIMPFENMLVIIHVNGSELLPLLNKIAKNDGWPISEGSGFEIKDSIASNIIINKKVLNHDNIYAVGVPDYIANGGDNMEELKKLKKSDTGLLLRELMIRYIKENKKIVSNNEERIKK
jgi:2',3'-cyclic-nucleotide 2'-phosphodiesterase (5'-nucleotidase family)